MPLDDDPEIEVSPLSGPFTDEGVTVQVEIYRIAGSEAGWSLEVIDAENASTVWDGLFPSDEAAFKEFAATVEAEGITTFLRPHSGTIH